MKPIIDHIHITVADLDRAEAFYDSFLPLLGFDLQLKEHDEVPKHEYRIVEYHHASLSIGIVVLCMYSGQKSMRFARFNRWFFYVYYPMHLTVIAILRYSMISFPAG